MSRIGNFSGDLRVDYVERQVWDELKCGIMIRWGLFTYDVQHLREEESEL